MSRRSIFRLTLAYPILTVVAETRAEPSDEVPRGRRAASAEIDLSKPGYTEQLRALGVAIRRAGGTLRVTLPEDLVWRGVLAGTGATAAARRAAAVALGVAPAELVLVAGRTTAEGTPFAAVARTVLHEARVFLRHHGLRPAAFVGAGDFPGFAAPPRLPAGIDPGARLQGALARWAHLPRSTPSWAADLLPGWPPSGVFVAGGGLGLTCAAVALVASLAPQGAPRGTLVAEPAARLAAAPAAAVLAPAPAAPVALADAGPPLLRPAPEIRPKRAERDTRLALSAPAPAPAPPRPASLGARSAPEPIVVMATRNVPALEGVSAPRDMTALRVAELIAGPRSRSDMTAPVPKPRPSAARDMAVGSAPAAILDESGAILRPVPRTGTSAALAMTPTAGTDSARPRPRLAADRSQPLSPSIKAAIDAEPVRVASLSSGVSAAALSLASPPEPRPAPARGAASASPSSAPSLPATSASRPAALPAAAASVAAPVLPRATVAVEPVRAGPAGDIVRPSSQTRRVAVAAPSQPRTQSASPAGARRSFAAAGANRAVDTNRISRGSLSLLGVFGTSSARHALIRLPNGAVQRVRAGDTVAGAEVASVAQDSVRLTSGGRESVLRMQ